MEMEIKIKVPEDKIKDILITAIESPPGEHWCKLTDYCQAPGLDLYDSFFLNNAGWMEFTELNPDSGSPSAEVHTLSWFGDLNSIQNGLKVMAEKAPSHFGDFMDDTHDAITADVFLQCCLLGEIVYG